MTENPGPSGRSVFLIGAAGGVGRPLAAILTARGARVTGLHRSPEQAERIATTGAAPVAGDLISDTAEQLAARMAGHDAVVFSAGAHGTGPDQTTAIDGDGLDKAAEAARSCGIRRFVLVSVFMDAGRGAARSEGFEHYMAVKRRADVALAATELDWLIIRPGTLLNDAGTGRVSAGPAIAYGSVPRADVAAFIAEALFDDQLNRTTTELTPGDTPVADAVLALHPRPVGALHTT
jgi:uncharacterized protein YbjT (DUF2867 family)